MDVVERVLNLIKKFWSVSNRRERKNKARKPNLNYSID